MQRKGKLYFYKEVYKKKEVVKVEKERYMISDAAGIVEVESHVLRYWEEELELDVPRNELGHRYYTKENIREFLRIKELKEQGYQLKGIKHMLMEEKEQIQNQREYAPKIEIEKVNGVDLDKQMLKEAMARTENAVQVAQPANVYIDEAKQREKRMEQFQSMMTEIVKRAIRENNEELGAEVSTQVGEHVIKEMNYLMRTQEEQEEERFRKLDEAIRSVGKKKRFGRRERLSRKEKKELKNQRKLEPDLSI